MRKSMIVFMTVAVFGIGLLAPSRAEALATENITVTVTIQNLSVSLSANTFVLGTILTSAVVQMSESNDIVVTNDGNVIEDFSLLLVNPSGWTAGSSIGSETYVLSGLFVDTADAPTGTDFNAEDVITTSGQTATATLFGEAGLAGTANGLDVAINGTTDLWLEFQAPDSTNVATEQSITVTVGAETS